MSDFFDLESATARSKLYRELRAYFSDHGLLEVDVPILGRGGPTDVHLASVTVTNMSVTRYLQASPEFFMKRLLAAGSGDIFTICKAFRKEESGRLHNSEFSILEWYRLGYSLEDLIADVFGLFHRLDVELPVERYTYRDLFLRHVGIDPHMSGNAKLREAAGSDLPVGELSDTALLDYFMSTHIEPNMPKGFTVVTDFPAAQAALAKTALRGDVLLARRFEIYWDGIELANGYEELTDLDEQLRRFDLDQKERRAVGLEEVIVDAEYLKALEKGLPECSGVAIGLDRLLMCMLGKHHIKDVMLFNEQSL